jgi:hypothetical protein
MRYLLNGPINLWDRIGGRKPNRRPLSESRTEQSESFPRCRLGPYCRRYFFSIPPTRKKGHPDVVNLRACVVCGSAEGQHHMRGTARACQCSTYLCDGMHRDSRQADRESLPLPTTTVFNVFPIRFPTSPAL